MSTIKLSASCGTELSADKDAMMMSTLLKSVIEDAGTDDVIPLPNVSESVLKKIIEYCVHHKTEAPAEIPKPLRTDDLSDYVSEFDAKFIDLENNDLFALLLAANYMDIKPLLDLSCAKVATMIKGKTPDEIRKTFNISNDFTPEEEAQVTQENRWVEGV